MDYTPEELVEYDRIRNEVFAHQSAIHPMMDHYASIAHFVMKKLRQERGFDFQAAEARRLRARLAEIDRNVMERD